MSEHEEVAGAGHNIGGEQAEARLRSIVDRHERLDEEVKALRSDQKEILQEAKSAGYDLKALRQVMKYRRMERNELQELDSFVDLYRRVLGV
jgi:uncharacterized protein (UPF0335 family)